MQIKAANLADFNDHCGTTLNPHNLAGWDDPCRQISAQFLIDVLSNAPMACAGRSWAV
jgi:hypothetical protein